MNKIIIYCGLEQWSALLAHNQEVEGLNPSSATNLQDSVERVTSILAKLVIASVYGSEVHWFKSNKSNF